MDRRNTCIKRECPFWTRYRTKCPNYVTSDWETVDGHKYPIEDCAPKRSMILAQQMYNMMLDVRKDANRARNANIKLVRHLQHMTNSEQTPLLEEHNGKDSTQ